MKKKILKAKTNGIYSLEIEGRYVWAKLDVSRASESGRRKMRRLASHLNDLAESAEKDPKTYK